MKLRTLVIRITILFDQSRGSLKLVVHRDAAPQQTLWVVDFLSEDINDQDNCWYNGLIISMIFTILKELARKKVGETTSDIIASSKTRNG